MKKKIVYVDMDNTIVDFRSGIKRLPKSDIRSYQRVSTVLENLWA